MEANCELNGEERKLKFLAKNSRKRLGRVLKTKKQLCLNEELIRFDMFANRES